MASQDSQQQLQQRIENALEADIPEIYFNSSVQMLSLNDVMIVLERSSKPVAVLHASWSQVKSLVEKLNALLQGVERALGAPIRTQEEISSILTATRAKRKKTQSKKRPK